MFNIFKYLYFLKYFYFFFLVFKIELLLVKEDKVKLGIKVN